MPLLALGLLLAQLVAVPAPDGGTVEADPAFDWALRVLARRGEGRPLGKAFANGDVPIQVAPDAPLGRLALYEPRRRMASAAPEVAHVAPGTLAALLAHEASHVQTCIRGTGPEERRAVGRAEACYADEWRALQMELHLWQVLHPRWASPCRPMSTKPGSMRSWPPISTTRTATRWTCGRRMRRSASRCPSRELRSP